MHLTRRVFAAGCHFHSLCDLWTLSSTTHHGSLPWDQRDSSTHSTISISDWDRIALTISIIVLETLRVWPLIWYLSNWSSWTTQQQLWVMRSVPLLLGAMAKYLPVLKFPASHCTTQVAIWERCVWKASCSPSLIWWNTVNSDTLNHYVASVGYICQRWIYWLAILHGNKVSHKSGSLKRSPMLIGGGPVNKGQLTCRST